MRIAAITMARNDLFFLERWVLYYGNALGRENLYILLDGEDQEHPSGVDNAQIRHVVRPTMNRVDGEKDRLRRLSELAAELFRKGYEAVIGVDCDEFIIPDPKTGLSLAAFIEKWHHRNSLSALGLDVGQHLDEEPRLDPEQSVLAQRKYALLSGRYSKPSILYKPLRWGSGFHRVKGHGYYIAPDLYLIHIGYCDLALIEERHKDKARIASGWQQHVLKQAKTIRLCTKLRPHRSPKYLRFVRCLQQVCRKPQAWNKPLMPGRSQVVEIPASLRKVYI